MHKKRNFNISNYEFIFNNINGWINNIDNKISILLAFLAVALGFIVCNDNFFNYLTNINLLFKYGVYFIIILLSISCFLCILALLGRIKAKVNYKSKIYFGSISNMDRKDYFDELEIYSIQDYIEDLKNQIFINSCICDKKVRLYNYALKMSLGAVLTSLSLFVIHILK